jgi:hypothetical protein
MRSLSFGGWLDIVGTCRRDGDIKLSYGVGGRWWSVKKLPRGMGVR